MRFIGGMEQSGKTMRPLWLWLLVLLQAGISASSLVVEIVAGRMIAPYVGMSLYTWTSIIAVVLAGFSVGHWWGGRVAARTTTDALRQTGWVMVAAALSTAAAGLILRGMAAPIIATHMHPLMAITLITSVAFFLPSVFAGVPAPILTVAAMRGRAKSEQALGIMFASGAIGAIVGTVLAGFVFVPFFGSLATLSVVAVVYGVAAVICFGLAGWVMRQAVGVVIALGVVGVGALYSMRLPSLCDYESSYYCIRTVDLSGDPERPVHLMVVDHLAHGISAEHEPRVMFTDHAAMLDALPRMRMGTQAFTSFHIGGGSYSVPRAWQDRGIGGMTVAEIDPQVTQVAQDQFWYDPTGMRILHQDARVALAQETVQYDVIIGDAFTDIAVPEHLVTQEFFELVATRLTPRGVFAMNVIDSVDRLDALAAMVVTLRGVFPSVELWTEARPPDPQERRVFVLLCGAGPSPVDRVTTRSPDVITFEPLSDGFIDSIIARKNPTPLSDDFAPLSYLMGFDPILK